MKILVTGGAGYIGSHTIVEIQQSTDWEIVSIDNYCNSSEESYDRIQNITGKPISQIQLDLRDFEELSALFQENNFDGVMHFAALKAVGESVEKPFLYYDNNIVGLINLIKAQLENGVKRQLYSSSCTVYGAADTLPVTESSPTGRSESPYGYSKVVGEKVLKDISETGRLKTLALRYFNPVGAHMSGKLGEMPNGVPNNLLPFITQTAAGHRERLTIFGDDYPTRDGSCIRDYIHVTDIARAHIAGMNLLLNNEQKENFDFINLGTGRGISVKEIVHEFKNVNDVEFDVFHGPRRTGDVMAIYADNSKALEVLKWKPEHSLRDMVSSSWKWQQYMDSQSL